MGKNIATPDNPCSCGNIDYWVFWCDECKRPEDCLRESASVLGSMQTSITSDRFVEILSGIYEK